MLYPTETLDLLPPVEQIDAHLKHQKSIFRPRADGFLKEKAERKVREMACSSRFSDFRVWQAELFQTRTLALENRVFCCFERDSVVVA